MFKLPAFECPVCRSNRFQAAEPHSGSRARYECAHCGFAFPDPSQYRPREASEVRTSRPS